jgi:KaiC/GvpD/RAD55 family RecA-like ATPase
MSEQTPNSATTISEALGGYMQAVDAIMQLNRVLWDVSLAQGSSELTKDGARHYFCSIDMESALNQCGISDKALQLSIIRSLRMAHLSGGPKDHLEQLAPSALQPLTLLRQVLSGARPDQDLRYFAMANVRKTYSCVQTSRLAQAYQLLANEVNSVKRRSTKGGITNTVELSDLISRLRSSIKGIITNEDERNATTRAFIESCRLVNYFQAHQRRERIILRTDSIDSAYLLSNLFGMTTDIIGFDELFGGGGIILADHQVHHQQQTITGRSILTLGRYGTGKSILSMQFALNVALKGGIAYILSVEQEPEEYLYGITSVCTLPDARAVKVATNLRSAMDIVANRDDKSGAIVIVNPIKESFLDFASSVKNDLEELGESFPIKMLVIDPISAIKKNAAQSFDARAESYDLIASAKSAGWNVWLVAEEFPAREGTLDQEQNIADTVIRLSVDYVAGYTQRYFEITKSRFQREQRGHHAFSIVPGKGVRIYPSSAAVSARIKNRSIRPPDIPVKFGLDSLDGILGEGAIRCGDIVALQGPSSTCKSLIGLSFLFGIDQIRKGYGEKRRTHSLLISIRDNSEKLRKLLHERQKQLPQNDRKSVDEIRICSMAGGYVKPGYILQMIEEEFLVARINGYGIDRVMLDDLGHWDVGCPFIREDDTFGDTLVDLLRRHQVTSLVTCSDTKENDDSVLIQSVTDSASCLIRFQRVEFRGERIMARVIKTRKMQHRRGSFEVLVGSRKIDIDERPSLLRITANGETKSISVRLFLHHENAMQETYNKSWVGRLRYVLSPDIAIDPSDSTSFLKRMKWAKTPAIDELHISQIDEYQLSRVDETGGSTALGVFDQKEWRQQWDDILPRLHKKIQGGEGKFCAVPFFVNISILGFREHFQWADGQAEVPAIGDWLDLAEQCVRWESEHSNTAEIFFDYPGVTDENYNCLFLEILLWYGLPDMHSESMDFIEWIRSENSIKSCVIMRKLCRRAHMKKIAEEDLTRSGSDNRAVPVDSEAIVWRLWYSTANQLFASILPSERDKVRITSLPKEKSIAGEWYLAIPSHSSAREVGLHVIEMLTTHEEELARMRGGVGLPTRKTYYCEDADPENTHSISPFFSMNSSLLSKLVNGAFERSSISGYMKISGILASHLRRIIQTEGDSDSQIEQSIRDILVELEAQLNFLEYDLHVTNESMNQHSKHRM